MTYLHSTKPRQRSSTTAQAESAFDNSSPANENLDIPIESSWLERHVPSPSMGHAGAVIAAIVFLIVGYAVYKELETVTWSQVRAAIETIGWMDIGIAALATTVSYIALIGYDLLAPRQVGPGSASSAHSRSGWAWPRSQLWPLSQIRKLYTTSPV